LAVETHTENIKFIEGLIVAARTFGGEIIFFSISGQILERLGHVTCFSLCFFSYSLRLWLIWLVPSPWWIIFIEFVFSGPCYALSYSTIVVYANELAPPGASATMQGITPNVDDGLGWLTQLAKQKK
jgi:MFS family permease